MADPISTASGILAIASFTIQSSQLLYQAVASFRSNQRTIRELKEELFALKEVLKSLQETAALPGADFKALELPLRRCGKACRDFEAVITDCTKHSGGDRTSFRDWAKLTYMGGDIVAFKNLLAGYKSTIVIALGDVNIRNSVVTAALLNEYKDIISNTSADLEEHLQDIDSKLKDLALQGTRNSEQALSQRQEVQEERDSTQQCLDICGEVLIHINRIQVDAAKTAAVTLPASVDMLGTLHSARVVTADAVKACRETMSSTTTRLERHLEELDSRLRKSRTQPAELAGEETAQRDRIKEEIASIEQCLAICAQASAQANGGRVNVYEDISTADDGHQMIISTVGDLISAKRITSGARSTQWLGQMSDDSLQRLSQNHGLHVVDKTAVPPIETGAPFEGRYGPGTKLSSRQTDTDARGPEIVGQDSHC